MKKLISMVDYVLEQKRPMASADLNEADYYYKEFEILEKITNYANFLKQPLTLGMFVPCDENCNLLDIQKEWNCKCENKPNTPYCDVCQKKYKQAKERVLFEGFIMDNKDAAIYFDSVEKSNEELFTFRKWSNSFFKNGDELKTVEEIIQFNLTLTDNAIKQIGL